MKIAIFFEKKFFKLIQNFRFIFKHIFSSTVADLSEGIVALSIEDPENSAQNVPVAESTEPNDQTKEEPLLPLKMCYEWKEITQEFFEAVKGTLRRLWLRCVIVLLCLFKINMFCYCDRIATR